VSCCEATGNGQSTAPPSSTPIDAETIFEVADFSVGQPQGELVDNSTIDLVDVARARTLTFEVNRNGATSWAIGPTNGLRLVGDSATATSFNTGTFDANWLRVQFAMLWAQSWASELDGMLNYSIEAYFDLLTMAAGLPGVAAVFWGLSGSPTNAAARMQGVGRGFRSAVQTAFGKFDANEGTNYTSNSHGDDNTLAATIYSGASAGAGFVADRASVAAGWPRYQAQVNTSGRITGTVTTTLVDENVYAAIGQWSGNAAGAAMITQLRSLRMRAWR
jgi:hypothetical protein